MTQQTIFTWVAKVECSGTHECGDVAVVDGFGCEVCFKVEIFREVSSIGSIKTAITLCGLFMYVYINYVSYKSGLGSYDTLHERALTHTRKQNIARHMSAAGTAKSRTLKQSGTISLFIIHLVLLVLLVLLLLLLLPILLVLLVLLSLLTRQI